MSLLPTIGVWAPTAMLAAATVLSAALFASPLLTAALLMTTSGCLAGTVWARLLVKRSAGRLARATAAIAANAGGSMPVAASFGVLAPVAREVEEVAASLSSVKEAATTDRLTHVANRPTLLAHLFSELERVSRYGRPISVAFIDIDHFKQVNDTYGHAVGDVVLRGVADVFRAHTRTTDLVGRYGGEEFVVVLPETNVDEATAVAEKLRLLVLKESFPVGEGREIAVSISVGIAGGSAQHLRVDQLLRDADAAMYAAKSLGRNQTYVFAETDDDAARIPRAPISAEGRARAAEVGEMARRAAEATLSAVVSPLPHYRGKPSSLIAAISVRLARELELPEQEVERIRVASLLHDIGKVAVPEQILEKPAPLTPDEWQTVVQHPRIGQVIIDQVAAVKDAGTIILHHHEKYSGHGYPHGLRGSDIPLGARIVAIADAYDAMVSDRPYRAAVSHDAALTELRTHATMQFDPELVSMFCKLYSKSPPKPDPSLLVTPPVPFVATAEPVDLRRTARRRSRAASA